MPAESQAQQKLMGMALAYKRGKMPGASKKIKEVAEGMSEKQLKDFAKTKHEDLPEKKAFVLGFVKRAMEYGHTEEQAVELLKKADSSFLGRYLASGHVVPSILRNKPTIMQKLDPTGEYQQENLILSGDMYKKQRELAYDHMRNTLLRESAGPYWSNMLLGGALGALGGGAMGYIRGADPLVTAGIGAGIGATGSAVGRAISKLKQKMITDEDIARMKQRQKDNSFLGDIVPFRDVVDAAKA